jgi:hypothetical protein
MVPNFYIIGAQKAGTTSLNDILAKHPDIFMPDDKEIPYFYDENLFALGKQNYEWYFRKWKGQKRIGNAPVNLIYLASVTAKKMYEFDKNLKFICCLRNPIDRAYSAYWYFRSNLWESAKTFEEALAKESCIKETGSVEERCNLTYIDHGLYYEQLLTFYEYFSPDQILVLLFEDLKNKPHSVFECISKFLDIDYNKFSEFEKKSNITSTSRIQIIDNLIYKDNKIKSVYNKILSNKSRYKMRYAFLKYIADINKRKFAKPLMKKETRDELVVFYKQPNMKLEKMLNVDLSHWK